MQKIKIKIPVCGCDRSKIIGDRLLVACPICKKEYREQEITIMKDIDNEIIS